MSTEAGRKLVAAALWRRLDVAGAEHFRLWSSSQGHRLEGTIVLEHEHQPWQVEYEVACSLGWETTRVTVVTVNGDTMRRMGLFTDDRRRWWTHRTELDALAGAVDVDISLTPSTNTLPIRRLGLLDVRVGDARDVTAAWLSFPDLSVEPLRQRYTRLSGRRFRYESDGGRFTAELEVDDLGLVVSYPVIWRRTAFVRG